jgi:hypothetical protein
MSASSSASLVDAILGNSALLVNKYLADGVDPNANLRMDLARFLDKPRHRHDERPPSALHLAVINCYHHSRTVRSLFEGSKKQALDIVQALLQYGADPATVTNQSLNLSETNRPGFMIPFPPGALPQTASGLALYLKRRPDNVYEEETHAMLDRVISMLESATPSLHLPPPPFALEQAGGPPDQKRARTVIPDSARPEKKRDRIAQLEKFDKGFEQINNRLESLQTRFDQLEERERQREQHRQQQLQQQHLQMSQMLQQQHLQMKQMLQQLLTTTFHHPSGATPQSATTVTNLVTPAAAAATIRHESPSTVQPHRKRHCTEEMMSADTTTATPEAP